MIPRFSHRSALWLLLSAASASAAAQDLLPLPKTVQAKYLLPGPATVGSDEYKAEIEEILSLQASRTEAQIQSFHSQEKLSLAAFKDLLPVWCTPDNLPKLQTLYKKVSKAAAEPIDAGKSYFKRERPFHEDKRIQPLGRDDHDFAYPSGHATRGMLYALILAQVDPEKTADFLERGRQIGWNRVIGGMHHPSDIAAGRVLGQAIARALLRDPDFKTELEAVKEEFEAAKKSHAEAAAPAHAQ